MKKRTQIIQTLVRMPVDMRKTLEEEAKRQRRSLSAEILMRLERAMAQEQAARATP